MAKKKPTPKFKGLYLPAALLANITLSMIEKILLADIKYFTGIYNFQYPYLAKKFGQSRSTIIRAIERLSGKMGMIESGGNTRNRCLKLTEKAEKLFSEMPAPKKKEPFVKPESALEVVEYAASIDYEIDGEKFIDWYTKSDWKTTKGNKLTSWKQAVVTWKKRDNQNGRASTVSQSAKSEPYIR